MDRELLRWLQKALANDHWFQGDFSAGYMENMKSIKSECLGKKGAPTNTPQLCGCVQRPQEDLLRLGGAITHLLASLKMEEYQRFHLLVEIS